MDNFTLFERAVLSTLVLLLRGILYISMKLWFNRVDDFSAQGLCEDILKQIGKVENELNS